MATICFQLVIRKVRAYLWEEDIIRDSMLILASNRPWRAKLLSLICKVLFKTIPFSLSRGHLVSLILKIYHYMLGFLPFIRSLQNLHLAQKWAGDSIKARASYRHSRQALLILKPKIMLMLEMNYQYLSEKI